MKSRIEIFSSEKLQNFFNNFNTSFDIVLKTLHELKSFQNPKHLSIVFCDDQYFFEEKILYNLLQNENFIFVSKEFSVFGKLLLSSQKIITSPLSVSKFLDKINDIVNKKKHTFKNIDLENNLITNTKTKEKIHLTEAENLILSKLLNEKNINKKLLERETLQIKEDLNTSSMESHLNRIRKKLKKIDSDFSLFSKDNMVFLEVINLDK